MASYYIFKPNTSKGPVWLHSGGKSDTPPTITLADGTVVTGVYKNTVDEGSGPNSQYVFPRSVLNQKGAKLTFEGKTQDLGDTNMSYRGSDVGSLSESSKGSMSDKSSGGDPRFTPGKSGNYGAYPAYMGNEYPDPKLMKTAPYKFTDPQQFASKFGDFNRGEYQKNFDQAKQNSFDMIDAELKSLQSYVPAMSALQREQTSIDNIFNQQQRTQQLDKTLPGARQQLMSAGQRAEYLATGQIPDSLGGQSYLDQATRAEQIAQGNIPDALGGGYMKDQAERANNLAQGFIPESMGGNALAEQGKRAAGYAQGRLPDSMGDAALELGMRSQSADNSSAGGFGAQSSVARKASDLMSAQQRFQIGQYGEGLTASNVAQRTGLALQGEGLLANNVNSTRQFAMQGENVLSNNLQARAGLAQQGEVNLANNVNQRASLELAPTAYSNAGAQVRVNPTLSASQLMQQQVTELNNYSMITPTNAMQSTIQQNQFTTGLENQTRQFNTTNQNSFALGKFNYDVSYAGAVAGASQTDINTQVGIDQQNKAAAIAEANKNKTQDANTTAALASFGTTFLTTAASLITSVLNGSATKEQASAAGVVLNKNGSIESKDGSIIESDGSIVDKNGNIVSKIVVVNGKLTQRPLQEGDRGYKSPKTGTSGSNNNGVDDGKGEQPGDTTKAPDTTKPDDRYGEGYSSKFTDPNSVAKLDLLTGKIKTSAATTNQVARSVSSPAIKDFMLATNLNVDAATSLASNTAATEHAANMVLQNVGISQTPMASTSAVGYDLQGKPIYSDINAQKDNNPARGLLPVTDLQKILAPVSVSGIDSQAFNKIKAVTMDANLTKTLDAQASNGKFKEFVNTLQSAFGNATTGDPKVKDSMGTALASYKLAQTWKAMSGSQKALAISGIGLQSIKTKDGKSLTQATVDGTNIPGHKPLTVGAAIEVSQMGANLSEVKSHWEDLSSLQMMFGRQKTTAELVKLGQEYGYLSK